MRNVPISDASPRHIAADGFVLLLVRDSLYSLPAGTGATARFIASINGMNQIRSSPDGKPIAFGTNENSLSVVLNWPALLKQPAAR